MPVYALGASVPDIAPSAFVHPEATVIGNVTIGEESTIWPQAVLRGDYGKIVVGARTSIQDSAIVHNTEVLPTVIGDDCTVGHLAHLEGCTVHNAALIGTASIILHEAVVETGALVGANAVVTNRLRVPAGAMALGVPAKIREGGASIEQNLHDAAHYVQRGKRYRLELRRMD